jgi:archaellum component FlaC
LYPETNKAMKNRKLSEDELRWRAEEDARTIERYNEIINDKSRLDRAMKAAKKEVENLTERVEALNRSITGIKKRK